MDELTDDGVLARETYCKYRRFIHPKYEPGKKYNSVFNKIGLLVSDNGIDINTFMEVNFKSESPYPWPNTLLGARAIERCLNGNVLQEQENDVFSRLRFELDYTKDRIAAGFPVECLFRRGTPLSVVFRYYIATEFKLDQYAKLLEAPARRILDRDAAIRKVYMPLLEKSNGVGDE